ncbi:multicopper oxidase family protein [Streptomyces sp. NPDC056452]|uniref:multicopper oxidase family protein n=1 Tax=Streptomyces sp. NPDC056452 TaxID=3345821 RepID=UPI003695A189
MADLLTRRSLIVTGTLATAGALVPLIRTLTPTDAPADGPPLPTLPELDLHTPQDEPATRTGTLTAGRAEAGRLAYNGTGPGPGPLLRLREGDRVRLTFRNDLDTPSSLHLHGVPMPPATDAPLAHLAPGQSDVREFTLPPGSAGTYWYHPHAHGDVERQLLAGLAGPIVITGPADDQPALRNADDRLLMFTRTGRDILVNGATRPVITARTGRTRLRLLNATAGDHLLLALTREDEPTTAHLIATDSGLVERPVPLTEILLAPGERAEILVATTTRGRLTLRALPYSVYGPGGQRTPDRPMAAIDIPTGLDPVELPASLLPVEKIDPATAARTRRILLDGAGNGSYTIDGRTFDHHRVDLHASLDTLEIWEVENTHTMDHPFHLHSYAVQLIHRDGKPEPFRAWRDTVNIPAGTTVRLAVPLRGKGGRTVYHCHIAAHEDLGMMGILEVTGTNAPQDEEPTPGT